MAFDISAVGGYGTGSLGNVTIPSGNKREYPTNIQTYTSSPTGSSDYAGDCYPNNIYRNGLTVGGATLYLSDYSWVNTFLKVGNALLFVQMRHKDEQDRYGNINNNLSEEVLAEYGKYEVRTITAIDGDNYTLDQAPAMDFANYYVAIVPFLDFENLTLNSGGRLRLLQHEEGLAEGILAVRVKNTLTLNGGHINLFSWAASFKGNRAVLTEQEKNGALDADAQAGLENFITKDRFLLNGGQEGGLFLLAKNIVVESADSRIGVGFALWNAEQDYWFIDGVQYCRGAADSPNRPTDLTIPSVEIKGVYATNKSGATILIACETFQGFTPALIAKYTMEQVPKANSEFNEYGNGKGLARCYIACKNPPAGMKHDEGLYALDVLTDGDRLRGNRVFTFGNGQDGDATNPAEQINSYAEISSINSAQVTLSNIDSGSCPFEAGAMVMIHALAKSTPPANVSYVTLVGAAALSNPNIQARFSLRGLKKAGAALTASEGITNSDSNVTVYGTAGDDTITNYGSDVTIMSGGGNDEIHLASGSKRNVIVVGVGGGSKTYYGLGDTDTILVSLSGEEYHEERTAEYVKVELKNGSWCSQPCSSGNVVSVTGGTLVEDFTAGWIYNTASRVSVRGTSGDDSIYSGGSNVTIITDAGSDVISLGTAAQKNIIVRRFNDGLGSYYGLDSDDTILISLSGGTYWEQRENNFVRIHYGNVIRSEPCAAGNAVSVVGATKIEHPSESLPSDWIVNRADNVSIYGSDENDAIANYGSNCTIWGGAGTDTISMASDANNNVVIMRIDDELDKYINLNSTDTLLVSLDGGEYFTTLETEDDVEYRVIRYGLKGVRLPLTSGAVISVTGGTAIDYVRIENTRDNATIIGTSYNEYIINRGSGAEISCGGGNDTVDNYTSSLIDLRDGANVVNNYGALTRIYSSNGQNKINNSGASLEIYFSGNDTVSIGGGVKYNVLRAWQAIGQPVIYGFNSTTTLTTGNAGTLDYTLTPVKPDLQISLEGTSGNILLKDVYSNTGIIHINEAAIAISPDDYTYNYAAGDGNIAISGFDADSTLNVTGNFIWERHGNDIIVGVSENDTPIIYTGDISANDFPRDSDFKLAKIITYSGGHCSLDTAFDATPDDYYLQLISIPQYKNFTLSNSYTGTPKWSNGRGGICALAVSDTCNLTGGKLNVEGKGHGLNVGNELDGNAFMRNHLPLGNGHGSIFLLAKNLKMNAATRIGATSSGAAISNYEKYGGKRGSRDFGSKQGAHVLIVADKIEGLTEAAISTGGDGAGSGYSGDDGISGAAFIYCNS